MAEFLIVSEAARALEIDMGIRVCPRDISTLFYQRELRDDLCPIVGGRRLIPRGYLPQIGNALRRFGKAKPHGPLVEVNDG